MSNAKRVLEKVQEIFGGLEVVSFRELPGGQAWEIAVDDAGYQDTYRIRRSDATATGGFAGSGRVQYTLYDVQPNGTTQSAGSISVDPGGRKDSITHAAQRLLGVRV